MDPAAGKAGVREVDRYVVKYAYRFEGLTRSSNKSEALLGFLFAHITKPEFQVRWRWQPNDIAIWDNRVTQHYANADYLPQRRIMHRATILGDIPFYRAG